MPSPAVWTRAKDNLVWRLPAGEAAARMGISKATVIRRRRELAAIGGPPAPPTARRGRPPGKGPGPNVHEMIRRYQRGNSQAEIARQLGVSKQAVHDALRRYGHIQPPSRGLSILKRSS